jgi:hypothetical protein
MNLSILFFFGDKNNHMGKIVWFSISHISNNLPCNHYHYYGASPIFTYLVPNTLRAAPPILGIWPYNNIYCSHPSFSIDFGINRKT